MDQTEKLFLAGNPSSTAPFSSTTEVGRPAENPEEGPEEDEESMYVVKRDGRKEVVQFDKITSRIRKLCYELDPVFVDPVLVSQKVIASIYAGVSTVELDELAAQTAAYLATQHPDFSRLAARISVSNLHKQTSKVFSESIESLYRYRHPKNGEPAPLVADDVYAVVQANKERLNSAVINCRDFEFEYFGFKTLERSYLLKIHGKPVERPQHLFMRVAVGIHLDDIDAAQ
jgi:hypothetical protein